MIPPELEGTLLRNGPGLLEIGGKPLSQPLDGDGMVRLLLLYAVLISCALTGTFLSICANCAKNTNILM